MHHRFIIYFTNIFLLVFCLNFSCCKKLVEIPPPIGTITTSQVFATDDQATSAVLGLYHNMIQKYLSFASGGTTIYSGMSADELIPFNQSSSEILQFLQNNLLPTNSSVGGPLWGDPYSTIYQSNAVIEGLNSYSGVHESVRAELTGEAKFIRAFCYFYLVNEFGDVPLVTTINWHNTNLLPRASTSTIYQQIVNDLLDARNLMASDFSAAQGERIIPNKWAATAMLARVYLYLGQWDQGIKMSASVIDSSELFSLVDNVDNVFLANSSETIWQLQQSNLGFSRNATPEGFVLVPSILDSVYPPYAYITDQLMSAFESGDQRRLKWVDSTMYGGTKYYFPYKYKMGGGQATPGGP